MNHDGDSAGGWIFLFFGLSLIVMALASLVWSVLKWIGRGIRAAWRKIT